jgi:hypothetical protein
MSNHQSDSRRRRDRGRSQRNANFEPPPGVTVEIVPVVDSDDDDDYGGGGGAAALVKADKHGDPAVYFAPDTPYYLRVENRSNKHVAFNAWMDGQPVSASPLMVRGAKNGRGAVSRRMVTGFVVRREKYDDDSDSDDDGRGRRTVTTLERFVARRPASQDGPRNESLGVVRVEFYGARRVKKPHSEHHHAKAPERQTPKGRKPGVLVTRDGPRHQHVGYHASGPRYIPDKSKDAGQMEWTIYEKKNNNRNRRNNKRY